MMPGEVANALALFCSELQQKRGAETNTIILALVSVAWKQVEEQTAPGFTTEQAWCQVVEAARELAKTAIRAVPPGSPHGIS